MDTLGVLHTYYERERGKREIRRKHILGGRNDVSGKYVHAEIYKGNCKDDEAGVCAGNIPDIIE